jgi:hypothetical protein
MRKRLGLLVTVASVVMLGGCFGGPARRKPPTIDASASAAQALKEYDGNGDGKLGPDELDKVPAVKAELADLGSGVTADKIAERIRGWQETKVARTSVTCVVKLNGALLKDATVTLVPEKFLGDQIRPCRGETGNDGTAILAVPGDNARGIPYGFYRIEVSKKDGSRETVPERYNAQTTLGVEVGPRAHIMLEGGRITLTLASGAEKPRGK